MSRSFNRLRCVRLCESGREGTADRGADRIADRLYELRLDDRGRIDSVQPDSGAAIDPDDWDLGGDWLSPGGVDLQINGALGLAFPDLTAADRGQLTAIGQFLRSQGVAAYLPTIVTTAVSKIQQAIGAIADYQRDWEREQTENQAADRVTDRSADRAEIWGVHLEGPFLAPAKRGAHPEAFLLPLNREQVLAVLGDRPEAAAQVRLMTLAPELDPTGTAIDELRSLGIVVSLGHSQATAAIANAAFDRGATMVTHAFNAMPSLHHREPGLLGAALARAGVRSGFIADGEHVCPTILRLLLRAGQASAGLFLVSDALAPLGLPDGIYPWDDRQITVQQGTARLADGTLSGTTLPLLAGVQNLVQWGLAEPAEAIALATIAPRRALGRLGEQANPYIHLRPIDLLRWHQDDRDGLRWSWLADRP